MARSRRRVLADVLDPSRQRAEFDAEGYFEAVYAHFAQPGVWSAYPEVGEVLDALRGQGLALGVISNFDRRLYAVFDDLGLTRFFDHIVISSEVGADKPDPFIFQHALELFRRRPAGGHARRRRSEARLGRGSRRTACLITSKDRRARCVA